MDTRRLMSLAAVVAGGLLFAGCFDSALVVDPGAPQLPDEDPGSPQPPDPEPLDGLPAIAFVSNRDGSPYIYVATTDGASVARLTQGEDPSWSWDGRSIAFTRGQSQHGPAGIWVMNADGRNQSYVGLAQDPSWSPDGRILFHSWGSTPQGGGIGVMNRDGSNLRMLIGNSFADFEGVADPSWSPDGTKIAFRFYAGYEGGSQIYIMNADGSDPHEVRSTTSGPSWSPDGTTLAVQRGRPIVLIDVVSRAETYAYVGLRSPPWSLNFDSPPDWSPDGNQLLIQAHKASGVSDPIQGWPSRIFVVSLETGVAHQVIPEVASPQLAEYRDYDATWSRAAQ